MDARLAQVRATVDERQSVAKEKRRRNDAVAMRVEELERHLANDILPRSAHSASKLETMEKYIASENALAESVRCDLVQRKRELQCLQTRGERLQRQIDVMKQAKDAVARNAENVWAEILEDAKVLDSEDQRTAEITQKANQLKQDEMHELQHRVAELDGEIAAEKREADRLASLVRDLQIRKRTLGQNIQVHARENEALHRQLSSMRRKMKPAAPAPDDDLEDRLDAILKDLDDMGSRSAHSDQRAP